MVVSQVRLWIVDTGCGHDLISIQDKEEGCYPVAIAEEPVLFETAGGSTTAKKVVRLQVDEL